MRHFFPALCWLRTYDPSWLRGDAVAGITLAAYLLPAGLGDASLANLPNGLGADDGPGFGWRDMTVYKVGASYAMSPGLTLRGGFATGKQPIRSEDAMFNLLAPGVVENHLTLGATWTLADKSELTVGYMHAFSHSVSQVNAIPPGMPPGMGGGNVELKMEQNSLCIAYARRL